MTGLQLMGVIENIPMNTKKHEMCQEMFF